MMVDPNSRRAEGMVIFSTNAVRWLVTFGAVILLIGQQIHPDSNRLNAITLGLLGLAILPWILPILRQEGLASLTVGNWKLEFQELEVKVVEQQEKLHVQEDKIKAQQKVIDKIVAYSLSGFIYGHLKGIVLAQERNGEYLFHRNDVMPRELQYLQDSGFIEYLDLDSLTDDESMVPKVKVTQAGRMFVELRESLEDQYYGRD